MARWVWQLDQFDSASGKYLGSTVLDQLSDQDVRDLLGLDELGEGDLYDLPEQALAVLARRFRMEISPGTVEYLLGRGSVK